MKRSIVLTTLAIAAATAVGTCFPVFGEEATEKPQVKEGVQLTPDTPIATVNGKPISKGELDRALNAQMRNFRQMGGGMHSGVSEPNQAVKDKVLGQLVDRELLYQESVKFPVENLSQQVDQEVQKIQERFPNAEAFQQAFEGEGLTEKGLKDLIGRQVSVRHYVEQEILPSVTVKDEDVKGFYEGNKEKFAVPEQVRCSHILIRAAEDASDEQKQAARKKAEDVRTRSAAGEDFAELAKEFSEDPGSAQQGGDLGFFGRDQMVAPFSDAAFALDVGQVSEVVETRFGYHVIKMIERKAASQQAFDEVKDQIAGYLKSQAVDQAVRAKVDELKTKATIEVVSPPM